MLHDDGAHSAPRSLYAGTYAKAGGSGIYPLLRCADRTWSLGEPLRGARNASYATYSSRFDLHFLLDEQGGTVSAWRSSGGQWLCLSTLSTAGCEPCFVALDEDQGAIAIANYGSGSLAYFRLERATGLPQQPPIVRQNAGGSVDRERQNGPHAHCTQFSPDGCRLFQTDLGTDEILAYAHDAETGELGEAVRAFAAPPGSGPRHLIFSASGEHAYLMSELASSVTLFEVRGGRLDARQTLSTRANDASGDSLGGHIALDRAGVRLYASNRGDDSIAIFAIGAAGQLTLLEHAPAGGRSPRFFMIRDDERLFLVANESDGTVGILHIDADGLLGRSGADLVLPGCAFLFEAKDRVTVS